MEPAMRNADPVSERRRHRQDRPGWWAWLKRVRRSRRRAGDVDGAPDGD